MTHRSFAWPTVRGGGGRVVVSAALLAVGVGASGSLGDEDWRKLKDLQPPYLGPGITGVHIAGAGGGEGAGPRGPNFAHQNVTLLSWLPSSAFGSAPSDMTPNSCAWAIGT